MECNWENPAMKMLDIAQKDLLRSVRGATFLFFGFVVPLLMTGIFYLAFGDMTIGGDGGFSLPTTAVQVVNLDRGTTGFSAGELLVEILHREELADLLDIREATDAASARAAVDSQQAGVAIIIPDGFSAAVFDPQGQAAVEFYQDPTLVLGPGIVKGIVSQLVDGFAGSKIAVAVAGEQLAEHGIQLEPANLAALAREYGTWSAAQAGSLQGAADPLLQTRSPGGAAETSDVRMSIVSGIMAGMMVFYVFFSGAATAQSILLEEEAGTLSRIFTTPTPPAVILGGRIIATLVTLVAQLVILLLVSALVFNIDWGDPVAMSGVTLGLIVLAASSGLFATSLLKNSRQGGIVQGGVMTVLGIVGMIDIFTANVPGTAGNTLSIVPLLVPQGWAVRGWALLLKGGGLIDVLPTVAVMLALSAIFFLAGLLRFRRRFA
jgi:ABC-2 type transport system permease protein